MLLQQKLLGVPFSGPSPHRANSKRGLTAARGGGGSAHGKVVAVLSGEEKRKERKRIEEHTYLHPRSQNGTDTHTQEWGPLFIAFIVSLLY
jgi:hypothetical protein